MDGLSDAEVSKGVLDCLKMCHHLDEHQFFTTTVTLVNTDMQLSIRILLTR